MSKFSEITFLGRGRSVRNSMELGIEVTWSWSHPGLHFILTVTKSDQAPCEFSHVMLVYWITFLVAKSSHTPFYFKKYVCTCIFSHPWNFQSFWWCSSVQIEHSKTIGCDLRITWCLVTFCDSKHSSSPDRCVEPNKVQTKGKPFEMLSIQTSPSIHPTVTYKNKALTWPFYTDLQHSPLLHMATYCSGQLLSIWP